MISLRVPLSSTRIVEQVLVVEHHLAVLAAPTLKAVYQERIVGQTLAVLLPEMVPGRQPVAE